MHLLKILHFFVPVLVDLLLYRFKLFFLNLQNFRDLHLSFPVDVLGSEFCVFSSYQNFQFKVSLVLLLLLGLLYFGIFLCLDLVVHFLFHFSVL